ncbi:MAG: hypothetical protein ACR2GW_02945 [Pyrinomonadaceae bacterium]
MRNLITPAADRQGRKDERGAALITALLISTLLLLAGGALVLTTSLSSTTTLDSTSEMQAYYLAEAGLQDALRALRGNIPVNQNFTGTNQKINFCRAVDPEDSNRSDDPLRSDATAPNNDARARLSRWLSYTDPTSATSVVPLGGIGGYVIEIIDPTDPSGTRCDNEPNYIPRQLLIRSNGFGPKRTRKVMEMLIDRFGFNYDPLATLVFRESQNGTNINPGPGSSGANSYSGIDHATGSTVVKPVVGAGSSTINGTTDATIANNRFINETPTSPPYTGTIAQPVGRGSGNMSEPLWPSFLASANDARAFLYGDGTDTYPGIVNYALTNGACPANNQALSGFTYINNNGGTKCTLGPGNSGSGLLLVDGTLDLNGNFNFSGLILVLGGGRVERSGGGGGCIYGGLLAANFGLNAGDFGQVYFDTDGGGNSCVQYDSQAIANALSSIGPRPLGVVEK